MEIFTKLCSAKLSFENFSKNSGFSAWDRILLNKEIIISRITFFTEVVTAWKVSKYGVFSGPYFPAFGLNTEYIFSPNAGKYGPEKLHMSP